MKWSKEPPKDAGWYWFRPDDEMHLAEIVRVAESILVGDDTLTVWSLYPNTASYSDGHWCGPIPQPEEEL